MTFDQFFEHAKALVYRDGRRFRDPDDDWMMRVVVDFPDEGPASFIVPPFMMATYDLRTLLGQALAGATRLVQPNKVALTQSAWLIDYKRTPNAPKHDDPDFVPPSESPHRFEAVFLIMLDREVERGAYACIHRRRRKPPVLGPWEQMPREMMAQGHLSDPLREALR
jgi:hypothetical protein